MTHTQTASIARALGRVPSGLYIVTTEHDGEASGFLGSFVMQMGFEPPIVCVAVGKSRPQLAEMRAAGRFGISILDAKSRSLMAPFLRKLDAGESPFDGLKLAKAPAGTIVLTDALAWLECKITSEHATGDHVVMFGEVTAGELLRDGEPSMHVRKNGFGY
jgi:flavin reductase (DIM6/NTAB) family NADH-FMN oxidoreductase RutF